MLPSSPSPISKLSGEPLDVAKAAISVPPPVPISARRGKGARLRKHADYQRVYHATKKQFSASMTWFLAARLEAAGGGPRVGLTAGKVLGKAHERNRIKRRMREAVRHHIHELPDGVDLILHPRRMVMTMDFVKLEAEVLRIFRQAAAQSKSEVRRKAQSGGASPSVPPVTA